jgi:class 3 adenylate cyclase
MTYALWYEASQMSMKALSYAYNAASASDSSVFSSATFMPTIMQPLPNESMVTFEERLYATRRPVVIIGDEFPEVHHPIVNVYLSPTTSYEEPPLTVASEFSRFTWTAKPYLADLAHAIALHLAEWYANKAPPQVFIAAETDHGYRVALKSMHTVQFAVNEGGATNITDGVVLRKQLRAAVRLAATGQNVVFFLSTITNTIVVDAMNAAADLTTTLLGTSSASLVFEHFVLAVATDQNNLHDTKFQMSNRSTLQYFPIFFGSYLYPFWEPGNMRMATVKSTMNTFGTPQMTLEMTSLQAGFIFFDMFTAAAEGSLVQPPTATSILDFIYDQSFMTVAGVTIGPIYDANCSAEIIAANAKNRKCQCFKILKTVNVYDFRDWLVDAAKYNPAFRWTMEGCGVEYSPLIVPSTLNKAMIVGIAVPCGIVALAAVVYYSCFFGRRSNRAAPKDPAAPFAMVFTDIQSSTSLWARAPEQMGDALELHHEFLRRLVAQFDGYEVKTIGDSFMVAFKHASDAAAFALGIQTTLFGETWPDEIDEVYVALAQEAHEEMLSNEDPKKAAVNAASRKTPQWDDEVNYPLNWNGIRVRVGLHWGIGSVKFDAVSQGYDYYGTLVNTAARVEGVGNGGQVLATRDFYAQLEDENFNFSDVDVLAMGPQPLRGLDEPVPLFQLVPNVLRGREFAALRLDVENDATDGTTTNDERLTESSGNADDTPESMLARLLKRQRDSGPLYEHLLRVLHFMETLLRTSPLSWRKETIKTLLKKWHVQPRHAHHKEPAETTLSFDMVALLGRVGVAAEESRRVVGGTGTHGTRTDAASSAGGSYVARRRGSRSLLTRIQSGNVSVVSVGPER